MDRRGVILVGLAAAAPVIASQVKTAAGQTNAAAANAGTNLRVEAPDDVSVDAIISNNGPVKKGQQLMRLKSVNIDRAAIQIDLFKEHIDIMERPFKDGRIDDEIALLKQKSQLLSDIVDAVQRKIDRTKIAVQMGLAVTEPNLWTNPFTLPSSTNINSTAQTDGTTNGGTSAVGPPVNGNSSTSSKTTQTTTTKEISETNAYVQNPDYRSLVDLQTDLNKANIDYLTAKLAAEQAERRRDDALAKIQLAKDKVSQHEKILATLQASMLVVSSVDGMFTSHIGAGFFAKRGHVLGEIAI